MWNLRAILSSIKEDICDMIAYSKSTSYRDYTVRKNNKRLEKLLKECEDAWNTPEFPALYKRVDQHTYQCKWPIDERLRLRMVALDTKAFEHFWDRRVIPDWRHDVRLNSMAPLLEQWFPDRYDPDLCIDLYGRHIVTDLDSLEPKYLLRWSRSVPRDCVYQSIDELREHAAKAIEKAAIRKEVAASLKAQIPRISPYVTVTLTPPPSHVPSPRPSLKIIAISKESTAELEKEKSRPPKPSEVREPSECPTPTVSQGDTSELKKNETTKKAKKRNNNNKKKNKKQNKKKKTPMIQCHALMSRIILHTQNPFSALAVQ